MELLPLSLCEKRGGDKRWVGAFSTGIALNKHRAEHMGGTLAAQWRESGCAARMWWGRGRRKAAVRGPKTARCIRMVPEFGHKGQGRAVRGQWEGKERK